MMPPYPAAKPDPNRPVPPLLKTCTDTGVRAGSATWLRTRKTGIGASEIASVLGIGPWGSPTELYLRKLGGLPDVEDNPMMAWGRDLEAVVFKHFLKCHPEYRSRAVVTNKLYRSNTLPWQLATPDAVVFDNRTGFPMDYPRVQKTREGVPVVVQVKTGHKREGWGEPGTDEIPIYYRCQVQQEMDVVGAEVAWLPVLFDGRDYREYRVRRDDHDIRILRARGAEFWQRIIDKQPPPTDGHVATSRALRGAFGVDDAKRTQVARDILIKLDRAKALEARLNTYMAKLENRLRAEMGDAHIAMVGDIPVARRSEWDQAKVDLKALRADHPDLVEKYTKTTRRTRLSVDTREMHR